MDLLESQKKTNSTRHPWEMARVEVVERLIQKQFSNPDQVKIILDIGCGDIFVASELSKKFPNASIFGIDTAFTKEQVNEINAPNSRIKAFQTIEEAELIVKGKADIVLLLDVLEHIEDDTEFLKYVKRKNIISNETKFVITVPAFQSLFCSHDIFLKHFRRYTNKSLGKTLSDSGMKKIEIGYFFLMLVPLRIVQVLKEKFWRQAKLTTGLVEWNGGVAKTNLIKKFLVSDYNLTNFMKKLGLQIPGLSNYAICQRRPA